MILIALQESMSNDSKVKSLLQETILTLCRASIEFKTELRIEGVIGITIDRDRVILVSLHTTEKPRDQCKDNGTVRLLTRDRDDHVAEKSTRDERAARRAVVGSRLVSDVSLNTSCNAVSDTEEGDSSMMLDHNNDDDQEDQTDIKPCIDNEHDVTGDEVAHSCSNELADNVICSVQNTSGETILNVFSASKRVKSFKTEVKSAPRHKRRVLTSTTIQPVPKLSFAKRIEAIQLYEKMQSSIKVAQHLGVGKDQIRRILSHKDQLLAHAQHDADGLHFTTRKKSLPFLKRVEAIHLYDVLKSTKKVAKHFGVGPTQIRDILKRRQELLSMAGETNEMDSSQP